MLDRIYIDQQPIPMKKTSGNATEAKRDYHSRIEEYVLHKMEEHGLPVNSVHSSDGDLSDLGGIYVDVWELTYGARDKRRAEDIRKDNIIRQVVREALKNVERPA